MQRLRVKFARGEELKFISHLDIMRLWQRALNRAEIPLAYSEGFNPHPRMSLGVPLAIGVTSEAELMDIFCARWVSPHAFSSAVDRQLPAGMKILQVSVAAPTMPSLQSQVGFAEYKVEVEGDPKEVESRITSLLTKTELPWQHQRDTGPRTYDLRTLVDDLWVIGSQPPVCTIGMRLRCDSSGSGRPEQVAAALGFAGYPRSVHRTRLILRD